MLEGFKAKVAKMLTPGTATPDYSEFAHDPTAGLYPWHTGYEDTKRTDAEKLLQASETGQVERILYQVALLMLNGRDIKVISPDDTDNREVSEKTNEVQRALKAIDVRLDVDNILAKVFIDVVTFGSSLIEFGLPIDEEGNVTGWGQIDGWKAPEWANYLDVYSFATLPPTRANPMKFLSGRVLKGIVWDIDNKNMEYWQIQRFGVQVPIKLPSGRILHIKDKKSRYPDGKSYLAGIIPSIAQLESVRKSFMQRVNVHGANRCYIKVNEIKEEGTGKPALNPFGKKGEPRFPAAYKAATDTVRNYGNNAVTVLWPEMDLQWGPPGDVASVTVPDDYLKKEILQHLIPRDWVEQNGNAVSKTGDELLDLALMVVRGWRAIVVTPFQLLYEQILRANGFRDWKVEFTFKDPSGKDATVIQQNALAAYTAGAITLDRFYQETNRAAPTEEERKELAKVGIIKNNAAAIISAFPRVGWDLSQDTAIRDAILESMGLPKSVTVPKSPEEEAPPEGFPSDEEMPPEEGEGNPDEELSPEDEELLNQMEAEYFRQNKAGDIPFVPSEIKELIEIMKQSDTTTEPVKE